MADLLNNTIGVVIGYGLYKSYYNIINKENKIYLIGYFSPIFVIITIFIIISIIYQNKEFGNLPFEYNYKLDLSKTNVHNVFASSFALAASTFSTLILSMSISINLAFVNQ